MTAKQLDLEQMARVMTAPYVKHSGTSKAAAKEIEPHMTDLQRQLLTWLRNNGPATDREMQGWIPMDPNTQRPRRVELVRLGLVRDTGEKRKTRSGRSAVVWEVI